MKLEELKEQKRWLCATAEKAPHKVHTQARGGHDEPDEWETYQSAKDAAGDYNIPHVGICLGNGLAGIDFDHVRDPVSGDIVPEVRKIIKDLDTYTEISKSGTGIHILMWVDPDRTRKRNRGDKAVNGWFNPAKDGKAAALAYSHPVLNTDGKTLDGARFYVFTGDIYEGHAEINERTAEFIALTGAYPPADGSSMKPQTTETTRETSPPVYQTIELDNDVWDKLEKNKILKDLFDGHAEAHVQNHTDNSSVDWAFAKEALKTYNLDGNIVYTLWIKSKLYRDKSTRKYGDTDNMGYTIRRATEALKSESLQKSNSETVQAAASGKPEPKKRTEPATKKRSLSHRDGSPNNYLEYLEGGWFDRYTIDKSKYADRVTGFDKLDENQPLYPGLYVFGAGSSMGKTTFIHQMAEQIAEAGQHIILFSLEMEKGQLVAKSLSRSMFKEQQKDLSTDWAVPAIDLCRRMAEPSPSSIERCMKFAERVELVEGSFYTTVPDIQQYVTDFIQRHNGIKPVVFVDYLQIIPPEVDNHRTTSIETASLNIKALKNFQAENDLVIFVISSLNRANYYIPLDFESFKNSGDIEYTADCIWGLELAVIQAKIFEDETAKKGLKRKIAAEAKRQEIRRIRLVCLKNRFGKTNFSVDFNYYPKYDYFECADLTDYYSEIARRYGSNVEEVDNEKENKETLQRLVTGNKNRP